MTMGLTPQQEIIHLRVLGRHLDQLSDTIARELASRPLHRIVTMTTTPIEQFNNEVLIMLVIEYLPEGAA